MIRRCAIALGVLIGFAFSGDCAFADIVTASCSSSTLSGGRMLASSGRLSINYNDMAGTRVFNALPVNSSSVGQTFTATSATSPDYAMFVWYLTHGTAEFFTNFYGPNGFGFGWNSSYQDCFRDKDGNPVDLSGQEVNSLSLYINEIRFDTPGSDPNHDGLFTDITVKVTLTVNPVPEPSTFALLGVGAVSLLGYRWRRRRA
jgi:hypothetical protein